MKFLLTLFASLFLALPAFAANGWRVFSSPFPIHSATKYSDGILVASEGGVRIKTSVMDKVYTANNGLETSKFYSALVSTSGVFVVSDEGLIATLNGDMESWRVISRSFIANGRSLLPDVSRIIDSTIVLVFNDRIAFFDVAKEKSILTVERIGDVSFAVYPPKCILIHEDELYVSTGKSVFVRKMDWRNLDKDTRLVDPESWNKVPVTGEVCGMDWLDGHLVTYPTSGSRVRIGNQYSEAVQDGSLIVLRGNYIDVPDFYEGGISRIKWIFSYDNNQDYLVGPSLITHFTNGVLDDVAKTPKYDMGAIYELAVTPGGGVLGASPYGYFGYSDDSEWYEKRYFTETGVGNVSDAYGNRMKVLSITPDGTTIYHIWGMGFYLYSDFGRERGKVFVPEENVCMENFLSDMPDVHYTISVATTMAPDSSGFLTTTGSASGKYNLVYISADGEMSCLVHSGSSILGGPIKATKNSNGVDWDIYVGTRDATSRSATGALDVYSVSPPSKNGGRMGLISMKTVHGLEDRTSFDMALDTKNQVLWLVTESGIGYYELDQDTIRMPSSTRGLQGAEYSSVDLDPHGNVWVGTAGQGIYRLKRTGLSFDTLSTLHFTTKDGMLSNYVDDLVIDPLKGILWMGHEQGVTWYKRNDLRASESFMTDSAIAEVKVFPNPFRPKQYPYVAFDNIAEDATISVFNRRGSLVKFFSGSDTFGGRVEWDGKGNDGKLVAPGVYQYIVKNSSKKKKGKLIIIH